MKIDKTRITLATQLAGSVPDGAETMGLVLEPVDRLHSALVRMRTGIYVTMCGNVTRSVDQREAARAVDATEPRNRYDAARLCELGYGDAGGDEVLLSEREVADLAAAVGGSVAEIETARCPCNAGAPARCECGTITGYACARDMTAVDGLLVEYMPEYLRASHEAAGNRGRYPDNGAVRLRLHPDCAAEHAGEWCAILDEAEATA
jgi:hypothetical protein